MAKHEKLGRAVPPELQKTTPNHELPLRTIVKHGKPRTTRMRPPSKTAENDGRGFPDPRTPLRGFPCEGVPGESPRPQGGGISAQTRLPQSGRSKKSLTRCAGAEKNARKSWKSMTLHLPRPIFKRVFGPPWFLVVCRGFSWFVVVLGD